MRFNSCAVVAMLATQVYIYLTWENPFQNTWFGLTASLVIPGLALMMFWNIPYQQVVRWKVHYTREEFTVLCRQLRTAAWRWHHRDLVRLVQLCAEHRQTHVTYAQFQSFIKNIKG